MKFVFKLRHFSVLENVFKLKILLTDPPTHPPDDPNKGKDTNGSGAENKEENVNKTSELNNQHVKPEENKVPADSVPKPAEPNITPKPEPLEPSPQPQPQLKPEDELPSPLPETKQEWDVCKSVINFMS